MRRRFYDRAIDRVDRAIRIHQLDRGIEVALDVHLKSVIDGRSSVDGPLVILQSIAPPAVTRGVNDSVIRETGTRSDAVASATGNSTRGRSSALELNAMRHDDGSRSSDQTRCCGSFGTRQVATVCGRATCAMSRARSCRETADSSGPVYQHGTSFLLWSEGMARGFESKSVESQQEESQRAKTLRPALSAEEQAPPNP